MARGLELLRTSVVDRLGSSSSASPSSPSSSSSSSSTSSPLIKLPVQQFVTLPLPVNYVAMCVRGALYTDADAPRLALLVRRPSISVIALSISTPFVQAPLLRVYLHAEIREKGGAYGGGAFSQQGLFGFYSCLFPFAFVCFCTILMFLRIRQIAILTCSARWTRFATR